MKRYGKCYVCKRVMEVRVLVQVEHYEGHLHYGSHHHQVMCLSCEAKADELTRALMRGHYVEGKDFIVEHKKLGGKNAKREKIKRGRKES